MTIRRSTRKNVLDWLSVETTAWSGRLEESQFLERVFDLSKVASSDSRYSTAAGDIWQHRVNNNDWTDDWVFTDPRFNLLGCPDETFLLFLTEMLHPVVRPDSDEARRLAEVFNDLLRDDGYELVARTRSPEGRCGLDAADRSAARRRYPPSGWPATSSDYVLRQITRMEAAVEDDPGLAIGTAKELVETTCKAILELRGKPTTGRADLPKLVRSVAEELDLLPDDVSPSAREPETVKRILGSLATVASGVAELRNAYGTGHGRSPGARGLQARHAKLAVGAAATLAVFLFETHEERPIATTDGDGPGRKP